MIKTEIIDHLLETASEKHYDDLGRIPCCFEDEEQMIEIEYARHLLKEYVIGASYNKTLDKWVYTAI
jgi:hypothetical protein